MRVCVTTPLHHGAWRSRSQSFVFQCDHAWHRHSILRPEGTIRACIVMFGKFVNEVMVCFLKLVLCSIDDVFGWLFVCVLFLFDFCLCLSFACFVFD